MTKLSGEIVATVILLISASIGGIYIGMPFVLFPFYAAGDFWGGLSGQPVEMRYRPGFQNVGLQCGKGGICD